MLACPAHTRRPLLLRSGSIPMQERVLTWLVKEHHGSEVVPKAALLHFLQQEYEVRGRAGRGPPAPCLEPNLGLLLL